MDSLLIKRHLHINMHHLLYVTSRDPQEIYKPQAENPNPNTLILP